MFLVWPLDGGKTIDTMVAIVHTICMKTTYSLSHAQRHLPGLVRESSEGGSIAITRHDETVAYVVSRDRMEAIVETMELLTTPAAMREIRAYEQGKMKFRPLGAMTDEG